MTAPRPPRPRRLSIALYRVLIRLTFPPSFRDEYAPEMVRAFADRASGGGDPSRAPALVGLWARTLADLARHGGAEWVAAARAVGPAPLGGLGTDVRQAARSLLADPAFTLVALATLALGVGANTAVFSVVDRVLLRPLPYPDADRLVTVVRWDAPAAQRAPFSYPDLADLVAEQSTFEALAPYTTYATTVQIGESAERVSAALAPSSLFRVLGVPPAVGRVYEEATPEREGLFAVVSARLSASVPGGIQPGTTLRVDGVSLTVTGIMPRDFAFPGGVDVWMPLVADDSRNGHWLQAVGRLARDASPERAEEELGRIVGELEARFPGRYVDNSARVDRLKARMTRDARPMLLVLLGSVGVVLLIACANLAGLSLVRATRRADDLRIRVALGASRGRIARLALLESVLLAAAGALLGLPIAAWGAGALARLGPAYLVAGRPGSLVDLPVLAFTLGLTALAGVLSGLLPALAAARAAAPLPRSSGRRVSADRGTGRVRGALVTGEVALAVALLAGAGLLGRTLVNLSHVPLGFDPGPVRVVPVTVRGADGDGAPESEVTAFVAAARERLLAIPGVTAAAAVAYPPFGDAGWGTRVRAEGAPVVDRPARYLANFNAVTPGYFEALGVPLIRGRTFTDSDGEGERVAVVSETLARTLWPDADAIGQRVTNQDVGPDELWMTVVGIVADVRNAGLVSDPVGEVYQPYRQLPISELVFLVSGRWELPSLADQVRAAVRAARAGVAVPGLESLADMVAADRGSARFGTLLLGVFAALAITLASLGIYGLIAYGVSQRRRELGLRLALGARPGELAGVAARSGLALAALGVVLGVALALLAGRAVENLLYGVDARDPATIGGVSLLVLAIAGLASLVPALRASRSDPVAALRAD